MTRDLKQKSAPTARKGAMKKKDEKPQLLERQKLEEKLSRHISELKLPGMHPPVASKVRKSLEENGVKTFRDLVKLNEEDLQGMDYVRGEKALSLIKRYLKQIGLDLGMKPKRRKPAKKTKKKPEQPKAEKPKAPEKKAPEPKPAEETKEKEPKAVQADEPKPTVREGVVLDTDRDVDGLHLLWRNARSELDKLRTVVQQEVLGSVDEFMNQFRFPPLKKE